MRADQKALRSGDQPVTVPLQQPGDPAAGAAGEHGEAIDPGVEGGGEAVPVTDALQPVPQRLPFGRHSPIRPAVMRYKPQCTNHAQRTNQRGEAAATGSGVRLA